MSDTEETEKPKVKRTRDPAFNESEDEALINGYYARRETIEGKHKEAGSNSKKKAAWEEIANEVNAVDTRCIRDVEKIKARYRNMLNEYKTYKGQLRNPPTGNKSQPKTKKFFEHFDKFMSEDVRVIGIGSAETGLVMNDEKFANNFVGDTSSNFGGSPTAENFQLSLNDQPESLQSITQDPFVKPEIQNSTPKSQRLPKKRKFTQPTSEEAEDLKYKIQQKQLRILEVQEKNALAQNAQFVLDYKKKAREMGIPDDEIQAKVSEIEM